ncbi:MAG TPA: hypothetical protein VKU42_07500 [Candidatus Angelobacter sp.]|nr:hypothetical protein [Candidatus Angelobacter sp.]
MNKKHEITRKIEQIAIESKKEGVGDWPVGDVPDRPGGNMIGDWPLGEVLPTTPELELFSVKVNQHFGINAKFSKSTKLMDIATMVHSMTDNEKT